MKFEEWLEVSRKPLIARHPDLDLRTVDLTEARKAYDAGESPIAFASRATIPTVASNPDVQPGPKKIDQPQAVKDDPKYQINTGYGLNCPVCNSTWVQPVPKQGTGLRVFGSIADVITLAAVDTLVMKVQQQPYRCCYCETVFPA